ncbi:equistatin-like [Oncorhynchus clarkii lewisi]|uniref:equistatin-like n=1 Tax=Oncorhynchus clarkii lewisi TaxID=490388 RepID=UPI0039B9BF76
MELARRSRRPERQPKKCLGGSTRGVWRSQETITMATLTIILLVSKAFSLGDATIRPMTPCERARYAATHGLIGAYIPTCDAAGRYTPKQCSGSTGYCWCVTTTGERIQGTDTPPGTAINC